ALQSVRQGLEQLQSGGEVTDGFGMSRALARSLPGLLPIRDGLLDDTCLRVVMREEFGLGFSDLRKALFQHLSNLLVILLPSALEQGLIRGILNQGMFEEIGSLREQAALIEQLCLD